MKIEAIGGKGPGGCETATCGVDQDILTQCDPRLIFPPGSANICAQPIGRRFGRQADACRVVCDALFGGVRAVFEIRPHELGVVLPERRCSHPAGHLYIVHDSCVPLVRYRQGRC